MKNEYVLFINLRRLKRETIAAFNAVKRLGYKVALLSKVEPDDYKDLVDFYWIVDTSNYSDCMSKAIEMSQTIKIAGIMAYTETSVEISSLIAEKLGLPGLPSKAIKNARNKYAMRESLMSDSNSILKFKRVTDIQNIEAAVEFVGYPAIIKPINSSGSIGVFTIYSKDDLTYFLNNYQSISNPNYDPLSTTKNLEFIVEEFLKGQEICVDGVVYKGRPYVYGMADKWNTEKHYIEYLGIYPSAFDENKQAQIKNTVSSILSKLGFDNCAFHMEGKVNEDGFKIIEVAARPAGDHIMSHLFKHACGEDMFEQLAKVSVGIAPITEVKYTHYSAFQYLLAEKEGVLQGYSNLEKTLDIPELENVFLELHLCEKILLPPNDYRKIKLIGFISKSANYKKALEVTNQAVKLVKAEIK